MPEFDFAALAASEEAFAEANGLRLCWQGFGRPKDEAILLISGLGAQMLAWPDEFCQRLAAEGFYVIRFDNRDIGRSEKLDGQVCPSPIKLALARRFGLRLNIPYRLEDLAADALGLLDALEIQQAHIIGCSMGGMIAQCVALAWPERCSSLTSIMSSTGNPRLPKAKLQASLAMIRKRPKDLDARLDQAVETQQIIGSPGYPEDEADLRQRIAANYQRSDYIADYPRQMAAVLSAGDRRKALADIRLPSLVIHGEDDPLVRIAAGLDTARHIHGAKLQRIPGMGHNLPRALWPRLVAEISSFVSGLSR